MVNYTVHWSSGFLPRGRFQDGGCDVEFLRRKANSLRQFVNVSSLLETEPHNQIKWTEAVVIKVRQNFIHQLWTFLGSVVFQESLHDLTFDSCYCGQPRRGRFSVRNSGSLFQSFLYAFRWGTGFCPHQRGVCNSEVSTRRESTAVDICVEY